MKHINLASNIQDFRYQIVLTLQSDEDSREYVGSHILNNPTSTIQDIWQKGRSSMARY
jgi:hypothetical protein